MQHAASSPITLPFETTQRAGYRRLVAANLVLVTIAAGGACKSVKTTLIEDYDANERQEQDWNAG